MAEALDPFRDDVIGVTTTTAARIVGVTASRLAAWERYGLVRPRVRREINGRYHRVYGLHDLVELRIVKALENRGQSIRHVRRVVEVHRSATIPRPLRELRWAVDAGRIYVGFDDGSWVGGKHPRQGVMPETINLDEIRADLREKARERPNELVGRLEQRPRTLGHKRVFGGTRTPVEAVHAYMRRGIPDSEILEAFPHLDRADLQAARKLLSA